MIGCGGSIDVVFCVYLHKIHMREAASTALIPRFTASGVAVLFLWGCCLALMFLRGRSPMNAPLFVRGRSDRGVCPLLSLEPVDALAALPHVREVHSRNRRVLLGMYRVEGPPSVVLAVRHQRQAGYR